MSIKILLVDDEPGIRTSLAANLELDGFEVTEAESGEQALEILGKTGFDVVLSDVRMRAMSGLELVQAIGGRHGDIPVVLTTAFALEETMQGAMRSGAFAMLPKPTPVAVIVDVLTRAARRPFVLVADDAANEKSALVRTLASSGVRACAASDGKTAIDLVARGQVDVCIVHTGTFGEHIVAELRELVSNVAIIALSSDAVPGLLDHALSERAFAYLRTPVEPGALVEAVAECRGRLRGAL
jgi:DNA-binding NtrC family response regulator